MKKQILSAGIMCAAAFVFTNCEKQSTDPLNSADNVPFEISASFVETKTANEGYETKWITGDKLSIFHAESGATDYGMNDEFSYSSGNKFTGVLTKSLEQGNSYNWFVFYPYSEDYENPTSGSLSIGDSDGMTQKGNSSTAHLCGAQCPLYGVARGVDAGSPVNLTMMHLTSVVKVVVNNSTSAPLTVQEVYFKAEEDIVGPFAVDITKSSVEYKSVNPASVSNYARLTVVDGSPIEPGGNAYFYIPIKPFTAKKGSTLEIGINGSSVKQTLGKDVSFDAGKFENVAFTKKSEKMVWDGKTTVKPTSDTDGVYHIKTADEFVGMLEDSRPYPKGHKYKKVVLESDIDLGGHEIYGFGDGSAFFYGVFDGQNHTVSNFVINHTIFNGIGTGLFNYNENYSGGATIKNLKVTGAKVTGPKSVGVIAGAAYQGFTIDNCHVSESVVYATDKRAGGIVGFNDASLVKNCSVENTKIYIKSSGSSAENTNCEISGYNNNGGKEENNTLSNVTIVRNYSPGK